MKGPFDPQISENFWKWVAVKNQAIRDALGNTNVINNKNTFTQESQRNSRSPVKSLPKTELSNQNQQDKNQNQQNQQNLLKPLFEFCNSCGEPGHNSSSCPKPSRQP